MIFDADFFLVSDDVNEIKEPIPEKIEFESDSEEELIEADASELNSDETEQDESAGANSSSYSLPWHNDQPQFSDRDYVIESDLVTPSYKPQKQESEKPMILVIDDDFETLDLLKIYFARGYEYIPFSGPREAIFYLNGHVPDLILLDCYIHTIKAANVVNIIHSYKELANVPIIYLCESYEHGAMISKLPEGVSGIITRPVSRQSIESILNKYLPKKDQ